MTRVATFGSYQSALLNLMAAQARSADAQERVSTQKNATDLAGFGRQSETLTALKGAQNRLQGFMDTADAVQARLTTQDLAMTQVGDGVLNVRDAVANTLATDSAGSLMLDLEGAFQTIRGGLTMRHQGAYLFAGASTSTMPVTASTLADLTAAPTIASLFKNDDLKAVSRVAEGTQLETGVLADDLGAEIFQILKDIKEYSDGPSGPLTGKVTEAQKAFLSTQLARLEQAHTNVTDKVAMTGSMANQVDLITKSHQGQMNAVDELVAKRTDADPFKAVTDLQMSEVAIKASAQVVSSLQEVSLLNFLR